MNRNTRLRQIRQFLKGKGGNDVDTFGIYQWIDRCYYESWWGLGVALGPYIPPHALDGSYHKRLEFLLAEFRRKNDSVYGEPTSIVTNIAGFSSQVDKTDNTRQRLLDGQQARNSFMEGIKTHIEQAGFSYRINLHTSGVLRAPSGKTGLVIELWIDRHNKLFVGVVFRNLKAKRILIEVLDQKEEDIRVLGYIFGIHEVRTNPDHGWIFSEIIYDRSKPLQDHLDFFVSKYAGFIAIFRAWISDVSFYLTK